MPRISTMHRALDMPEIVSMICGFAASEWKDCRNHHYCHSLALTCRRFREPALDVLWETLGNMAVLLKCFPSDVWIEERRNPESHWYRATVLKLARCPTLQDWNRPLYYATRVKRLSSDALNKVDAAVYAILAMSCPTLSLFPNLQHLPLRDMDRDDASVMPFRRYLMGPSITTLNMGLTKWENPLQATSFAIFVTSRCKPTCLDLSAAVLPDDAVAYFISEWSQLQKVMLTSVHAKTMQQMAALPNLRILKVADNNRGAGAIRGDLPAIAEGQDRFPALQQLVVRDGSIEACIWMLALMDRSPVKKLHMHFSETVSAEKWQHFIQRLPDAVDNQTLERLVLFDDTPTRDITRDFITSPMVAPLLCFQGLAHLAIRPRRPVHLDGAMMLDLGKALANLRYLDMRGRRSVYGQPTLSMHDLVAFALQCPTLETVGLSVDTLRHVPWPQPGHLPEDGRCSPSVTKIMVGDDAILEPKDLIVFASYLSFVFPNLYDIETVSNLFGETYFNWKRLEELLPLCRTVRQQGYIHGLRQEGREGDGTASFGHLVNLSGGWAPEPEDRPEDSDHRYAYDSA